MEQLLLYSESSLFDTRACQEKLFLQKQNSFSIKAIQVGARH